LRPILEQIVRRTSAGEVVALCTVVRTRGSTPQGAGAAMLVLADGQTLGTLGGGCVEAEVRTQALRLMNDRQSRLLTFKLDHDYGWDDGLVCGGTMEIAVQSLDSPGGWETLLTDVRENRPATLDVAAPDDSGQVHCFSIPLHPTPTLVIAGAGHVGQALAALATTLDFHVTVVDDRPDCLTETRFPAARRITGDIERTLRDLPLGPDSYVVILTRGHRHDAAALSAVIDCPTRYFGLIGSRRKAVQILRDLAERGVSPDRLAAVHAPIGLGIGAVTPSEIAISIAAELIAVRRGHEGETVRRLKLPPRLWQKPETAPATLGNIPPI
jgi:xanthine dehydrogenase accessory factor